MKQPWAPNARVLRSLFSDLAAQARTAFGSEVRFAVVDTGGGGGENAASSGNGAGGGGGGSGRAAASLAERCGVGALPSFQVWQGGELAVSLGGAEAAAVVASSAEEGEGEAAAAAPSAGLAARLRSALSGLKAFPAAASAAASAASAASSSAPSSSASLRTRLAEELRARAGPPLPPSSWLSRALRPLGPVARALSGLGSRHRRGLLAAAAAAAAVGLALGSAQSARASRKWQQERYDWLPSEAHRKRARAEAVARHAGRRAQLGGLSFLAPVSFDLFKFFLLAFFFPLGEKTRKKTHLSLSPSPPLSLSPSCLPLLVPILPPKKNVKQATYLLQWALGKGGAHGDSPLGPRFPTSEFSDVLDPPPVPLPDIDFENQVDGDKLKTWLLESRKLAARQKKRLAPERMEEEAAALGREVRRWEYVKAIEAEEARRARELSSSDASSAALLGDPRPKKEERRAVLAGDVEHVDLRGVYRRLGK
jgi:hypothetical protein